MKHVLIAIYLLVAAMGFGDLSLRSYSVDVVDPQGAVITDGQFTVTVYDQGTETLATIYNSPTGLSTMANPIIYTADTQYLTRGTIQFYAPATSYDVYILSAAYPGSAQRAKVTPSERRVTFTKAYGLTNTIAKSNVVYMLPPASSVTNANELIEAKLANDTVIYLMDGLYQISGDITLTGYSNLTIEGMGPQTYIKNVGTENYCCIYQEGPGHDLIIRNLTVDNDNIGNPYAAFNKCIFINGNKADPGLCYNILVEGITAKNPEAEALCFDYQFFTTVRNCIIEDAAWSGITMAQNKYGNIYNNKINRSGNSPAVVGTLCAAINVQSSPFTLVHDNWIRNPWYGGIGVSTSMDEYGPSYNCSVYGNIINGHLSGSGSGNSQGAIDVGISGTTATIVPYNIDIFSNNVHQTYLSAVQYTHNVGGPYRLSCSGVATTPFVDVEIGDKIYLDGDGNTYTDGSVNDGYYYVADIDEQIGTGNTGRDWIDLEMPHAYFFTPTNPEVGDVYSVTVTLNGVSSTKSYTCLAGTTVKSVINGLINAIRTSQKETSTDPWIYIASSTDYNPADPSNPTKLYLTACTRGSQYEFTASAEVTNAGGSLTPTISAARYYGLRATLSSGLSFQHGMSSPGIMVTDGTNIKIHDNQLNGRATSAAIMMASDIADGSNIFAWNNTVGANYSFYTRSLSTSVAFRGQPTPPSVNMTTVSPAHANCYAYSNGTTFTNSGEIDAMIWDVPPALVGADYIFVDLSNTAGADVQLDFAGTDTATGYDGTIDGNTDDSYGLIHLHCYIDGIWTPVVTIGTWS